MRTRTIKTAATMRIMRSLPFMTTSKTRERAILQTQRKGGWHYNYMHKGGGAGLYDLGQGDGWLVTRDWDQIPQCCPKLRECIVAAAGICCTRNSCDRPGRPAGNFTSQLAAQFARSIWWRRGIFAGVFHCISFLVPCLR